MWRRWRSWRRREKANAERGARNTETRNAERGTRNITGRYARRATFHFCSAFRLPTSALGGGGGAVKYFVTIGAQTIEVDVDGDRVLVGGEAVDVHLAPLAGTPLYHLLLAGASWTVAAQPLEGDGRWAMGVVGERVEVAVHDERTRAAQAASGTEASPSDAGPASVPLAACAARVRSTWTATSTRSPTTP